MRFGKAEVDGGTKMEELRDRSEAESVVDLNLVKDDGGDEAASWR